jgi:RNA polymerase sigma factor for flagellar operon FliA
MIDMPEDLDALWAAYKETGDRGAKDKLLLNYTYLVKWLARRMMPKHNSFSEYDDLVSCGVIGLITAMEKFDTKRGIKFETYAVPRVRGEILDYMRSQDWAPPSLRKKISAVTEAYETLEGQLSETPSEQAVADSLRMPVGQVRKILAQTHMFNVVNFEDALTTPEPPGEPTDALDALPENILLNKEKSEILAEVIESLSEKERLVVTLYYYEGLLLKEIAEILQVTESRVSQIHSRTIAKMRMKLER